MNIFERVSALNFPLGSYVVVGGGSLEARGLRAAADVDIVVTSIFFEKLIQQGWLLDKEYEKKWGTKRLKKGDVEIHPQIMAGRNGEVVISAEQVIRDADIIQGLPFQDLPSLLRCKREAEREKDARDVILIEGYLSQKN